MTPYEHHVDYLYDLFAVLDHRLAARLRKPEEGINKFAGLTVTREEAETALTGALQGKSGAAVVHRDREARAQEAERITTARLEASLNIDRIPALYRLACILKLTHFEFNVLTLALATAWQPHYRKLLGFLQDDINAVEPRIAFCLDLFCTSPAERAECLPAFYADAALRRYRLVHLVDADKQPLVRCMVRLDDHLLHEAMGHGLSDAAIEPWCRTAKADGHTRVSEHLPLDRLLDGGLAGRLFHFYGPRGAGKLDLAHHLAARENRPLFHLTMDRFQAACSHPRDGAARVMRQALLYGALLYIEDRDNLLAGSGNHRHALIGMLEGHQVPAVLAAERALPLEDLPAGRLFRLHCAAGDYTARLQAWTTGLDRVTQAKAVEAALLADRFSLTPGAISRAIIRATQKAALAGRPVTTDDCFAACRELSRTGLEDLARKITPAYTWDDIVIPADTRNQLEEICDQVILRRRVYETWKLHHKLAGGAGLVALFCGPSGTGKTMAAEIIAHRLGLELYKIDVSSMISKYVGETEKNLERLFRQAQGANAILFFDEADAIFGKRGDLKDAHDRYANIEVNYLLQRLESYEGVAILATNLAKNIDEAFVRRLRHVVRFPFPEAVHRRQIWAKTFGSRVPQADDIDLHFLAERFELAGGAIRNAAVNATFLAAAEGSLRMAHLIQAVRREYQKMGRLCLKNDFGPYFHHIDTGFEEVTA
ncbi:MAG: AAA family ATPase [Acidobacteriota bacterium]|nr:AAA family ATPase [Acidobacteriota bacterium]